MFKKFLIGLIGGISLFTSFGMPVSANISIRNNNIYSWADFSVNTYSTGQNRYYSVGPKERETWSRSDSRGFLIAVRQSNLFNVHYSPANTSYYFEDVLKSSSVGQPVSTVNKDADRFRRNSAGNYITKEMYRSKPTQTTIYLKNESSSQISAGISTWSGGQSKYFTVKKNCTESWSRGHDQRGYLLYLQQNGRTARYYVHSTEVVQVESIYTVYIDGKLARQIG
ncbi:hypothetical protein D920_01760 [Enterococcus faecalis 13-SD-W-01]|nr:hypothetical protein D920_01760 [Enterococcus faecalis 13-SD-W-01]